MDVFEEPELQGRLLWSEVFGDAGADEVVHIHAGQRVIIDEDIDVEGIIVEGLLRAQDRQDLHVSTDWMLMFDGGDFRVGTPRNPFDHDFTLELTGDNPDRDLNLRENIGIRVTDNDAFLMAMGEGSTINIHGRDAEKTSWTQLDATANAGSRVITVAEPTGWEVGDQIAIASSTGNMNHAEEHVIRRISEDGTRIWLEDRLAHRHYGEVETYDNGERGRDRVEWDLDLRAEVGLLSRNVTITGDENADRDQIGGHVMAMMDASMRISGTEFTKMGQADELGRYAAHWHMLGDGSGQYIENSSFHHTYNKGLTVHSTDNTRIENNVIYHHIGHGIYLEDGSETGTQILDNLVFSTFKSDSPENRAPVPTDATDATSIWVAHPNNTIIGNHAAGSEGTAIWVFPEGRDGSRSEMSSRRDPDGDWGDLVVRDNTVHSSRLGFFIDGEVGDDERVSQGNMGNDESILIEDMTAYHITGNDRGAVWIRTNNATIDNFMGADNAESIFITNDNLVQDSLIVARSEGNGEEDTRRNGDVRPVTGVRVYRTGGGAIDDSHFVGFDNDGDTAIGLRLTDVENRPTYVRGVTFEDTAREEQFAWFAKENARANNIRTEDHNQGARLRVTPQDAENILYDLDGSLTGERGTELTPNNPGGRGIDRDRGWESWSQSMDRVPSWDQVLDRLFDWR